MLCQFWFSKKTSDILWGSFLISTQKSPQCLSGNMDNGCHFRILRINGINTPWFLSLDTTRQHEPKHCGRITGKLMDYLCFRNEKPAFNLHVPCHSDRVSVSPDFSYAQVRLFFSSSGTTVSTIHLLWCQHYSDVILAAMASQITSFTIVYSTVYSESSASLVFVRGIHRSPMNSPHKWPVTRNMLPFDHVIMSEATLEDKASHECEWNGNIITKNKGTLNST